MHPRLSSRSTTNTESLELLKKQAEQAHQAMHSGSEAREAKSQLHEAEEDKRQIYDQLRYVRQAYYTDLKLILIDLAGMTPEEATLKSREWLETQRITYTAIPTLSLLQHMQSDQPPASSSSLGTVPTDPNLFGVVDQRNAGPYGPTVAETAISIGPEPIMTDHRSAFMHSTRTPATWATRLRGCPPTKGHPKSSRRRR